MSSSIKRLGALIPPVNITAEPEFNRWAPEGVTVHVQRMWRSRGVISTADLAEMQTHLDEDCRRLAFARPDHVVYACTSGSAMETGGYATGLADRISDLSGCPASTTATAVAEALRHMDVRRMAVVTPYPQEVNDFEMVFFRDLGFDPVNLGSFLESNSYEIPMTPQEATRELALKADRPEAEGIFISCTNLPTDRIVEDLERELGKPVITSNQATLWHALRTMGIDTPVKGWGKLLRSAAPAPA